MKILFLAPLPPPVTGHSLISKLLLDDLSRRHEVEPVDLSHGSLHDGSVTWRRLGAVFSAIRQARRGRRADALYLTISETLAGNLKDLAFYLAAGGNLRRLIVHLHGGSIDRLLFRKRPWVRRINAHFLGKVAAVVISGPAHASIFTGLVPAERVHTVFNFAPDDMFVSAGEVEAKFARTRPLRVLYLSGMAAAKGCLDLLDAWCRLAPEQRSAIELDFAGRFDSEADRDAFLQRIDGMDGVRYHGVVDEADKRSLFKGAHVFCLPSTMFEGQPISILEAYASGCAAIASGQPGIRGVFQDGENGFETVPGSAESIAAALTAALEAGDGVGEMGMSSWRAANERYRKERYLREMEAIFESTAAR
jgi:glycosyltransferase involved in cell wall biosynthesis